MNDGVASARPEVEPGPARVWLAAAGLVVVAAVLVPPVSELARRYEYVDALQFSVFAVVGPALVVVGAPWRAPRLPAGRLRQLADGRRRHTELVRSAGFLAADMAGIVFWRLPVAVDAVSRQRWLGAVEGLTLVVLGIGLWLELVESPPLVPRGGRPRRAVLAAVSMWTIWTIAYMGAMSDATWYRGFRHVAGSGVSAQADRQFSSALLWAVAAAAFMPVIFWNLVQWLRSEDDPDDELVRLLQEERRRAVSSPPASARAEIRAPQD